ncbi:hypothetical protein [Rhizorhabdus histidinilytica]|uniref:hypothetical protein n=1 Tax=Rhizorhabdus histidinilytica TaxID=439228 RepID=UPI00322066E1
MGTGSIGLGKVGAEAFAPPGVEALPGRDGSARPADRSQTPRIAFFFNAQPHQLLHGITTAEELALGWWAEVDILSSTQVNLDLARATVLPDSRRRLHFEQVGSPLVRALSARMGRIVPPKLLTLLAIRRRMNGYDAIALPERTSIMLRSLGVTRPRFIHIDHGAGDRAAGFDPRIARFDFALMAGEKQRRRMLVEGLIREEASAVVGYPKFDAADRLRDRNWTPFAVERPIILYNPHFSPTLGSWRDHGFELVRRIVEADRYNLIIAPHIRLCDTRGGRAAAEAAFGPFAALPHVHVDYGSGRSIDMTYTSMADIYLGDVSSQVYEFLRRPRPCLFVNSNGRTWQGDPNHDHWRFGPVIDGAARVVPAIEQAIATHRDFAAVQAAAFRDTFDLHDGERHSRRAAAAIAGFLGLETS